jgi:hypothetical protein
MKNSITLVSVLLLFSLGLNAQVQKQFLASFNPKIEKAGIRMFTQKLDSIICEDFLSTGELSYATKDVYIWNDEGKLVRTLISDKFDDNGDWQIYRKAEFLYDDNGDYSFVVSEYNPNTEDWTPVSEFIFQYNSNGLLKDFEVFYWDDLNGDWSGYERWVKYYNSAGNDTLYIEYNWDSMETQWVFGNKEERSYNENEKKTLNIYYVWNMSDASWQPEHKEAYNYNSVGNEVYYERCSYNLQSDDWQAFVRKTTTYNDQEKIDYRLSIQWNETENQWDSTYKEEYTYENIEYDMQYITYHYLEDHWKAYNKSEYLYGENDSISQFVYYTWDTYFSDNWRIQYKIEYSYTDNYLDTEIQYSWDNGLSAWQQEIKKEYLYNAIGDQKQYVQYNWDEQWIPNTKHERDYNSSVLFNQLLLPITYENYADESYSQLLSHERYIWVEETDNYRLYSQDMFYYSEYTSGLSFDVNEEVSFHPNPASDYIFIELDGNKSVEYSLYSVAGRKVLSGKLNNRNSSINIEAIPSGMYSLVLQTEKGTFNKKIVKN